MTVPKHTPGPWVEDRDDYDIEHGKHPGWIRGADGSPVVEYAGCGSHEADWPNPADKTLALAAPELLEALVAAIECGMVPKSSAREGGANAHARQARVADMIRDAIAKATGETP